MENELNKSFSYESNNEFKINDNYSLMKKNNGNYRNKILKSRINIKQKSISFNSKIKSHSLIIKSAMGKNLKNIKPIKKKIKIKKNIIKDTSNSTNFGGKKGLNYLSIIKKGFNSNHNISCNQRITSISQLENSVGGIFKIAVKYECLAKKHKDL